MPYLQYIVVETTVHSGFTEEMFEKSEKISRLTPVRLYKLTT